MSQKQFWYQEVIKGTNVYYNFLRYYILLNDIPLLIPKHKLPNEDLIEVTGFNINNFLQLMMVGYAYLRIGSLVKIDISNDLKEKLPVVTEENLAKCLAIFTGDYSLYRNTQFPNNPLYLKPLIKTDRGKLIISNAFIWTRKLYEGAYWLIREKYQEIGSQYFINKFGEYYERYIEEVLKYYLRDQQFKKIHEGTKKKADWIIETKNYLLIVEQKSSLMTIALKEEFPPLELLDEYLQRNFKEAYTQLAETKKEIRHADKRVLKFILHFERFYLGEAIIKERIKHICKDDFIDMMDYFFVETAEFEKLMQVLSEDEETFNKIIETKLSYQEKAPPISEGIEFNFIITKQARVSEIKFLESRRYHFDNLLNI
jgi:hypothetical protein